MPRRIVTADGRSYRIVEYDLPALKPDEVRVQVSFAAPKHGTEGHALSGNPLVQRKWDPQLRMFLPRPEDDPPARPGEVGIGNMVVGTVMEAGAAVTRWKPGDAVYGYGQVREVAQMAEGDLIALGSLSPSSAVCTDPAHVAFVAVRDGNIRVGDTVAVYGLGAIGLMAVQVARAGGARKVFAVDPLPARRAYAEAHGADAAFDPTAQDAALEIKRATGGKGVDVSIETSSNDRALHDAIRCLRQCGTVVHVPWGPKSCPNLHLDQEFHLNRVTIVGSQAWKGWGNPDRSHPLWDPDRAFATVIEMLRDGTLTGDGIVTPIVPFDEAPAALATIFTEPEKSIKMGITLP